MIDELVDDFKYLMEDVFNSIKFEYNVIDAFDVNIDLISQVNEIQFQKMKKENRW